MTEIRSTNKLSIPTGLQILLRDLDFLGQISRGQKACIANRVIVDGNTWSGTFYRAWKGENRIITITKIEQIVNQTVDAIDSHKNTDYLGIVINYFAYARNGVDALNSTYQNDPDMKARLNVQLKNIDLQLNQYRHLIKGYSNDKNQTLNSSERIDSEKMEKHRRSVPEDNLNNPNTTIERSDRGPVPERSDRERLERHRRRRRAKQSTDGMSDSHE